MEWGKTYFSTNYEDIYFALQNNINVIVLSDESEKFKRIGCKIMSALLPPMQTIEAYSSGDTNRANSSYWYYLESDYCMNIFAILNTALYAGKNILFFIPPEEYINIQLCRVLFSYMGNYGIVCGVIQNPPSGFLNSDTQFLANRLDTMYVGGYLPFERFIMEYPPINPTAMVCRRMQYELNCPELNQVGWPDVSYYCGDIIRSLRDQRLRVMEQNRTSAQPMICPVSVIPDFERRK